MVLSQWDRYGLADYELGRAISARTRAAAGISTSAWSSVRSTARIAHTRRQRERFGAWEDTDREVRARRVLEPVPDHAAVLVRLRRRVVR